MAGKKLTIQLTADQQNQVKAATGKSITELHLDLGTAGSLGEKELDNVAGGAAHTATDDWNTN